MDQALNQKIDAYIAQNKEQLLKDIAALVAVNSVEGTPEEGAPFGTGPRAALDKTLELAAGMGFATRNCENYIGYAELAGADPEKYLATICHVDVVPIGNGWTADPFKMRIQDGWLLGRGVADDKGPMVATLYALKFLKEQGYQLRYPIRAIVGDNEETHMNDVKYYLENYPAPVFCFTPDAEFPVCNGEKGLFGAKIVSPVCNGVIAEFEGGVANNAVPDRASALVKTDIRKLKNAPNITLEPEGDGVRVRGWGKSGHAAMPEGTVNAIGLVVDYLLDNGLCNDAERAYLEALKKLPEGGNMNYCFDYLSAMLAHNFMNPDQFAEFYWPYMKQVLDVLCEKKMHALIFSEGTILRYKDCFKDYPKGFLTILPETDDVFEIRKELPNIAIMGGMPNSLLGRGTKQACLDRAQRVIDELGCDGGFMFCQDKMGSFRNDANPENLKAVCDFVREYA